MEGARRAMKLRGGDFAKNERLRDAYDDNSSFLFRDDGGLDAQHRIARLPSLARGNWASREFRA
jgi:hypothetical protein